MVSIMHWLIIVGVLVQGNSGEGSDSVKAVRIVVPADTVHVKPCQPLFVRLVTNVADRNENSTRSAAKEIAHLFVVNGMGTPRQFSDDRGNVNGWLELATYPVDAAPDGVAQVEVTGWVFWDFGKKDFVFREPGAYTVAFGDATVDVVVDSVDGPEAELSHELCNKGQAFAMWVLHAGEKLYAPTGQEIEDLLAEYPTTAYTEMLRVLVGVEKFRDNHRRRRNEAEIAQAYAELGAMRALFEPAAQGELSNFFQVIAAFHIAEISKALHRGVGSLVPPDPSVKKSDFVELYDRIQRSPYAASYGARARAALRKAEE